MPADRGPCVIPGCRNLQVKAVLGSYYEKWCGVHAEEPTNSSALWHKWAKQHPEAARLSLLNGGEKYRDFNAEDRL